MSAATGSLSRSADPAHGTPVILELAARSDPEELRRLQSFLAEHRRAGVVLSAARLRRFDTLLLQVLIAARADWGARGLPFRLVNAPAPLVEALPSLGLCSEMIGLEVTP